MQSIIFANDLTMSVTGTGEPVRINANGLHFAFGKYLSLPLGVTLQYSGIAAFARITRNIIPEGISDKTQQQVIGVNSSTVSFLISIDARTNAFRADQGPVRLETSAPRGEVGRGEAEFSYTFGLEHDATPEGRSSYGNTSIWLNGRVIEAANLTNIMPVSTWVVGKDFGGTLHKGAMFFRRDGENHPLFPPGGSAAWAMDNLAI